MKKTVNLLRRKGFTLVECVVAIAVFAVLTTMVLMIVGNAVKLSKTSSDAEKDLNNVVDSVINDNSNKVYGADSKSFEMIFGDGSSANFKMSYTTVDGDKNYLQCPDCQNKFYNLEFMAHIATDKATQIADDKDADPSLNAKKISYWFDPSTDSYKCPLCGKTFTASTVKVKCLSCDHEDYLSNLTYSNDKGSYSCNYCNSGSLMQIVKIKDESGTEVEKPINMSSDATFMVSGMSANALRYGTVVQPQDKANVAKLTTVTNGTADVYIEYHDSASVNVPGYYTATIKAGTLVSGVTTDVTLQLPMYYSPKFVPGKSDTGINYTIDDHSSDQVTPGNDPKASTLKVTGLTSGATKNISFTLTNYKNGNSFEEDYKSDAGTSSLSAKALQKLWYGASSNQIAIPRQESTITLVGDSTATKTTS